MLAAEGGGGLEAREWRAAGVFSLCRATSEPEYEMKAKLIRLRVRDLALFVVVAGAVAVTTVCGARETGVDGQRAGARTESSEGEQARPQPDQGQSAKPLTLTLTGPSRCTTTRGQSYGIDEDIYDDKGSYLRTERRFTSHRGVKEFQVSWTVSGGTGPYTLTIDGASEDRSGPFTGASGRGQVFCADTPVATFIDDIGNRGFRADPMIDSGTKTVRAVVTDADGRTAETSIDVYVILRVGGTLDAHENDQVLKRGQTYRVAGHLITAPATHDVYIAGTAQPECPESLPEDERCEEEWGFGLVGIEAGVNLYRSDFSEASRWPESDGAVGAQGASTTFVDSLLDQLVGSVGEQPGSNGGSP